MVPKSRRGENPRATAPQRRPSTVLTVEGLSAGFPAARPNPILEGVDLTLAAGEVLGLVGASGSGKSLLARCICRLEAPARITAGRILLQGLDMCQASTRAAANQRGGGVVLIPQDPRSALDPLFQVGFQIEESLFCAGNGRRPRGNGRRPRPREGGPSRTGMRSRLLDLLNRTGIGDSGRRLGQYPHQWSRGMLQRALLAAAFAVGPRLLVLDEVTSALDPTIALANLTLIGDLARTHGTGVLFITHDLDQARFLCDRRVVLHCGRLVAEGAVYEAFTHLGETDTHFGETDTHPGGADTHPAHAPAGCQAKVS
jgi:ABC-type dipeptide/oligopeptide/nickel transport system ATPase component